MAGSFYVLVEAVEALGAVFTVSWSLEWLGLRSSPQLGGRWRREHLALQVHNLARGSLLSSWGSGLDGRGRRVALHSRCYDLSPLLGPGAGHPAALYRLFILVFFFCLAFHRPIRFHRIAREERADSWWIQVQLRPLALGVAGGFCPFLV